MRKLLAAVLVLSVFGLAYSADLPPRSQSGSTIMLDQIPNWAGFYIGVYFAGRWASVNDIIGTQSADVSGWSAGAIGGGNVQLGNWVVGIELDGGPGGSSGSNVGAGGKIAKADFQSGGHLRGRVGYAFDRWLVIAAGGWAVNDLNVTLPFVATNLEKTLNGWTIGGGVDYAAWNSIILRLEYLYDSYAKINSAIAPVSLTANSHLLRGAAMFHF